MKEEKAAPEAPVSARTSRKGPKPRGMAKFKPVKQEEQPVDESEMSAN